MVGATVPSTAQAYIFVVTGACKKIPRETTTTIVSIVNFNSDSLRF